MSDRLSLTGARWIAHEVDEERVAAVVAATNLSEPASRLLVDRFASRALCADLSWLTPSMEHLHDPLLMMGMERALARLRRALETEEYIRIITDYDVDGTTSSLILQAALQIVKPGLKVDYHIPNRFVEGYGFSVAAAEAAGRDGVDLIVTADIGVRDHAAVNRAHELGVDVLICDHHLTSGASVPEHAIVLCPPQTGCEYPNKSLAACGVSLKLAQALLKNVRRKDEILRSLMKLAAIGTVADMVSLRGLENRAIVTLGLAAINKGRNTYGLRALLEASSLKPGQVRESDFAFRLGPRINAAGRLDDASLVVRLFHARQWREAKALMGKLERVNQERKTVQAKLVAQVLASVGEQPDPFVLAWGDEHEGWHRGVVGVAAARVKDAVLRPVGIVSVQGDVAVGSIRSPKEVHAVQALESAADLLTRFGGHPGAAGFTVPTVNLPALRERLSSFVLDRDVRPQAPQYFFDAQIASSDLGEELYAQIQKFGPFGVGNTNPKFLIQGIALQNVEVRGKVGLLRFRVPRRGGLPFEGIWWGNAEQERALKEHKVDLLGHLSENHWRGNRQLRLELTDARIAS